MNTESIPKDMPINHIHSAQSIYTEKQIKQSKRETFWEHILFERQKYRKWWDWEKITRHTALSPALTTSKECRFCLVLFSDCIDCGPLLLMNITSSNEYAAEPEARRTTTFHLLSALTRRFVFLMNAALIVFELIHTGGTTARVQAGPRELFIMLFSSKVSQGKDTVILNHSKKTNPYNPGRKLAYVSHCVMRLSMVY